MFIRLSVNYFEKYFFIIKYLRFKYKNIKCFKILSFEKIVRKFDIIVVFIVILD